MAEGTCSVDGCDRPVLCRRLCRTHYGRQRANGSVHLRPTPGVEERFWAKVDRSGGCWLWIGYVMPSGYGFWQYGGQLHKVKTTAHRYSYELANGPIPEGLHIDHLCRVRACVRPDHLEAVTQAENNRRANTRTSCKRGHDLTVAENWYVYPDGKHRQCGVCIQMKNRKLL